MNKIQELIKQLCPNGVEWKTLGEVGTFVRGNGLLKSDFTESGFPCIHYGQIHTYYGLSTKETKSFCSHELASKLRKAKTGDLIIATTSEDVEACCKATAWLGEGEVAISGDSFLYHHNQNPLYIAYMFGTELFAKQKRIVASGAKVVRVSGEAMAKFEIPVPPLPIQTEIVNILDKFVEQQEQLEKLIELRKKQYEWYREEMLTAKEGEDTIPLADIAEIGTGSSNTNEEIENGKYPFFVRSQEVRSKNEYEFDEEAIITSGDGVGVGKIFHYINGKYALHQRAYRIHITDKKIMPKFFFYYMKNTFLEYISRTEVKSSVQSIRRPMLNKYPVPCYSVEKQKEITDIFDSFESSISALTSALELSKKRYEYYRDEMMRF